MIGPQDGPAQIFPVTGVIKNVGQFDECCFKTYAEVAEIDYSSTTTILTEDFSGYSVPPAGWTNTHPSNWRLGYGSYAGGTYPEAQFYWSPSSTDDFRLYSYAVDTSDYGAVQISFKHYVNNYNSDYTLKFETSPDGTSWSTVWETPGGSMGPETITITTGDTIVQQQPTSLGRFLEIATISITGTLMTLL
jgi:hypothetical protein